MLASICQACIWYVYAYGQEPCYQLASTHAGCYMHLSLTAPHCSDLAFENRDSSICLRLRETSCHAKFEVPLVSAQAGREHSMASDAWPRVRVPLRGIQDHSNRPNHILSATYEPMCGSMSNVAWWYSRGSSSNKQAHLIQGQEGP